MSILHKASTKQSSRLQVNIQSVKDGILSLPNNNYRMVLRVSSINFELRSEAEQDVLVETYQSFLNALPCPLQIIVRVREMDMDKYLEEFHKRLKAEATTIYRLQIENYSTFVKSLIASNKILARTFYLVLPFANKDNTDFEFICEQLNLLSDIIAKGLTRLGMHVQKLSSLEILELFYSFYNPGQAKSQPVTSQTLKLLKEAYL